MHNHPTPTLLGGERYLERAAKTSLRFNQNTGVMDGTVFREVLTALQHEGTVNATIAAWATALDARMHNRQKSWARQRFPCVTFLSAGRTFFPPSTLPHPSLFFFLLCVCVCVWGGVGGYVCVWMLNVVSLFRCGRVS